MFREEIVETSGTQVRTRQGGGEAPSSVELELSFMEVIASAPAPLTTWEIPPFRDPERLARTDRAFARIGEWNEQRRRG